MRKSVVGFVGRDLSAQSRHRREPEELSYEIKDRHQVKNASASSHPKFLQRSGAARPKYAAASGHWCSVNPSWFGEILLVVDKAPESMAAA